MTTAWSHSVSEAPTFITRPSSTTSLLDPSAWQGTRKLPDAALSLEYLSTSASSPPTGVLTSNYPLSQAVFSVANHHDPISGSVWNSTPIDTQVVHRTDLARQHHGYSSFVPTPSHTALGSACASSNFHYNLETNLRPIPVEHAPALASLPGNSSGTTDFNISRSSNVYSKLAPACAVPPGERTVTSEDQYQWPRVTEQSILMGTCESGKQAGAIGVIKKSEAAVGVTPPTVQEQIFVESGDLDFEWYNWFSTSGWDQEQQA